MIGNIHHDRPGELSGLGQWDWVTRLFGGKPQAWWDRLNRLQTKLAVQLAEVKAFGEEIWDAIQGKVARMVREGRTGVPMRFPGHAWAVEEIENLAVRLVATEKRAPSDEDLDFAERLTEALEPSIDFAKRVAPEVREQVEADAARVEANLERSRLRSPEEAGQEEFVRTLEERAKALGTWGGLGLGLIALVGVGLFALSAGGMIGGRRYRENPGKRRRRRRAPREPSLLLPLAVGGTAYLILRETAPAPGRTTAAAPPTVTAEMESAGAEYPDLLSVETRVGQLDEMFKMGYATPADIDREAGELQLALASLIQRGVSKENADRVAGKIADLKVRAAEAAEREATRA